MCLLMNQGFRICIMVADQSHQDAVEEKIEKCDVALSGGVKGLHVNFRTPYPPERTVTCFSPLA